MPLQINKKIIVYISFFILFSTLNNYNILKLKFIGINQINISGLSEIENFEIKKKLDFLKNKNLFFLKKIRIQNYLDTLNIIDNYTILKKYPSSLEIKIKKTNFLANVYKKEEIFFLGSNGKLIETNKQKKDLLNIFGNFEVESFFSILKDINESKFNLSEIKNLYYFKSGRWDIETKFGILIKLPKNNTKESLDLSLELLKKNKLDNLKILDLRQKGQVIINGN